MSSVEIFSKEQFEAALPVHKETGEPLWSPLGLDKGEYTYEIRVFDNGTQTNKRLHIRSSVHAWGTSAGKGKDSIRAWAEYWFPRANRWIQFEKGDITRIHRVSDWRTRLKDHLKSLYLLALVDHRRYPRDVVPPPTRREELQKEPIDDSKELASQGRNDGHLDSHRDLPDGVPPTSRDIDGESGSQVFDFLGESTGLSDNGSDSQGNNGDAGISTNVHSRKNSTPLSLNPEQLLAVESDITKPLRVLAPPGSGKTMGVICPRVSFILASGASPDSIAAVTFSRPMADELLDKILQTNPELQGTDAVSQITTIHALCLRMLRKAGDNRSVPGRDSAVKVWMVKKAMNEIIEKLWPVAHYRPGWQEVMAYIDNAKARGLDSGSDMELFGGVRDKWGRLVENELHQARRQFDEWATRNKVITFADMLYDTEQKLNHDAAFRTRWQQHFEYILVDEGQDTSAQAMRILSTLAEPQNQITMVGDTDQCIPHGELILTPSGWTPIQAIEKYDKVLAAIGKSKVAPRFVLECSSKFVEQTLVRVTTESGARFTTTDNHLCFASIPSYSTHTRHTDEDIHYVYIMHKRDYGYRIGVSRNPRQRLLGEHADKMWLIRAYDNAKDAYYAENLLSSRYGFPTMTFVDHKTRGKTQRLDQEYIDLLFDELDTTIPASRLSHNESFFLDRCPHIIAQGRGKRVTVRVTMCAPLNTKSPTHTISVETSNRDTLDALIDAGIPLTASKKGKRFRMHSQNIRHIQEVVSLISSVIDCEVIVRGAFVSKEDMEGSYSLTPQMMPAGNILVGFLLPIYRDDGTVGLDRVVEVMKFSESVTVYDLEIEGVANYFVRSPSGITGACVHNTLYRFAGATPEANLYEGFESRWPDGNMVILRVNYRSTRNIVGSCTKLIEHNYGPMRPYDGKYLKDAIPRADAPEGDPVEFHMLATPLAEGVFIAKMIDGLIRTGHEPGDFFCGFRTRAQTGYLEGPLMMLGIPYVNLAGTSFWGMKHVKDVVSYIKLAYNESDSAAFQRVYNIASADNADRQGNYLPHRWLGKKFLQSCYDGTAGEPRFRWVWRAVQQNGRFRSGVTDLTTFIQRIQAVMADEDLPQVIRFVVDECYEQYIRYEEGLTGGDESQDGKLEDFKTVADVASQFDSPAEFFDYVDRAESAAEAVKKGRLEGHVVLSTIHGLKGKERPIVFGAGFCEGFNKKGEPVGLLPHTFSMRAPDQMGVLPLGGMALMPDERDIAFVLISRGMHRVILTGCATYRSSTMIPSRFITEMGL